jgi:hypothetical protein
MRVKEFPARVQVKDDACEGKPAAGDLVLRSEALCAAGKCVAAAINGLTPGGVKLWFSQSGRWAHEVDGLDVSPSSVIGRAIVMAGTAARHLSDFDEPDIIAVLENVAVIAGLRITTQRDAQRFMELCSAAADLIWKHQAVVRTIAGRLVITTSMLGEDLAAHLALALRRAS